ncbi:MAG: efflux RND transporter periplasmic adaptor subunit [Planctomycetales bacterium]|nr:efflux RND transporter periplasmic adaptor subunit [Planctomycetales bacterium]
MKAITERILHYVLMVFVTAFAIGVMWKLSSKEQQSRTDSQQHVRPLATVAAPKAPVAIELLQARMCEITSTYAGKIRAWETYQVGFEVPGRVLELGNNEAGKPLDDGDRVAKGQTLAVLDDRVLRARKSEAAARVEQTTADLRRAEQIRSSNPSALSESELQRLVAEAAMARAQQEVAVKNLEDATLRSPVAATVSKRMVKSGESVGAHQIAFELVENDNVLLVVDVPESQIRELENRYRIVAENRAAPADGLDAEDQVFRAHVHLEGQDRFGNPWPTLPGEVYHIPEVADPRTGLFPVEIRLANAERLLRPGMVATAEIVTTRLVAYQIPEAAVILRQRTAHLFTVVKDPTEMELLYWNLGPAEVYRSRRIDLEQWVDQGEYIILPAHTVELNSVVVRGQFRLADSQLVRIMNDSATSPGEVFGDQSSDRVDVASGSRASDETHRHED